MIWFVIIVCALVIWLAFRATRASRRYRAPFDGADSNCKPQVTPQITLTMEVVRPDPAEWEREREEARKTKQSSIDQLRAGFSGPKNFGDALAAMRVTIARFAEAHASPIPNFDQIWARNDARAG